MEVDPAASMSCCALDVELGGQIYTVPALSAARWWPVLAEADLELIWGLIETDDETGDIGDRLLDGEFTVTELEEVLVGIIEAVAGRSLHAALVLAATAQAAWPVVSGQLAQHGFRWDVMPLGAALDAIYAIVLSNLVEETTVDGKKVHPRRRFLDLLEDDSISGRGQERAVANFEAVAGPRPTGGVRSTVARSGSARPKTRSRPRRPHPAVP